MWPPSQSVVREALRLRLLVTCSDPKLDPGEFVETLIVPFDEALAMVRDGRITDSKSVCSLLWVDKWGARPPTPTPDPARPGGRPTCSSAGTTATVLPASAGMMS